MKKILIALLLVFFNPIYGQEKISFTPPAEIDFLKEDPNMVLFIGLIQNVQTDWGKLGVRGKVKRLVEEQYAKDNKTRLSKIIYDFDEEGKVMTLKVDSFFSRIYIYSNKGKLEQEITYQKPARELTHKYDYKNAKLKNALYENNVVTAYGNDKVNLFYNSQGQVIKSENLQDSVSTIYGYNGQGRLVEKKVRRNNQSTSEVYASTQIDYNDKSDIERKFTQYLSSNPGDTSFIIDLYKYKYDDNDNWIDCKRLGGGDVLFTHRRIYYHDGTYSGDTLNSEDRKRIYSMEEVDIPAWHSDGKLPILDFLTKNIRLSRAVRSVGRGKVKISMIVSDKGIISDIKIDGLTADHLTDILPVIPKKCIPAKKNGIDVATYLEINITFGLVTLQ